MTQNISALPVWVDAVSLTVGPGLMVLTLNSPIPEGDGFVQQPAFRCVMTRKALAVLIEVAGKALAATKPPAQSGLRN